VGDSWRGHGLRVSGLGFTSVRFAWCNLAKQGKCMREQKLYVVYTRDFQTLNPKTLNPKL